MNWIKIRKHTRTGIATVLWGLFDVGLKTKIMIKPPGANEEKFVHKWKETKVLVSQREAHPGGIRWADRRMCPKQRGKMKKRLEMKKYFCWLIFWNWRKIKLSDVNTTTTTLKYKKMLILVWLKTTLSWKKSKKKQINSNSVNIIWGRQSVQHQWHK